MDCTTGKIYHGSAEELAAAEEALKMEVDQVVRGRERKFLPLDQALSKELLPLNQALSKELLPLNRRQRKSCMRNKPCVCGSGVKFKRCCWAQY